MLDQFAIYNIHNSELFPGGRFDTIGLSTAQILTEAVRMGTNLELLSLPGARLSGVDLKHARLRGAYLKGADLSGADLRGADLYGVKLDKANLRGANLSHAKLDRASLELACLVEADLRGAYLVGTQLCGADLTGAQIEPVGSRISEEMIRHEVPKVDFLNQKILRTIKEGKNLNMAAWGSVYCVAGLAVVKAGIRGFKLEKHLGTGTAAALIFWKSGTTVIPKFYTWESYYGTTVDEAMEDLRARAEAEKNG